MLSMAEAADLLLSAPLIRAIIGAGFLGLALWAYRSRSPGCGLFESSQTYIWDVVPVLIPVFLSKQWLSLVNKEVLEPYLDEFFHIPQAQVYCKGAYLDWDDKITTPPGLYIMSIIWARFMGYQDCSVETLRRFNVDAIGCTAFIAASCGAFIENSRANKLQRKSAFAIHTAINIALFPVLFFYSGLYYTDVLSTCTVLGAYSNHLKRLGQRRARISALNDFYTILLGVLALFMRQTNVFWVVVYMGALEAVQAIRDLKAKPVEKPQFSTLMEQVNFYSWRYSVGDIHDPPLNISWPADLALCTLSIGVAIICNLGTVVRRIYSHIVTLLLFVTFVICNGGVVLGDKSNHVATIHLAQMLYLWPLFAFFSAPLLIPQVLRIPFEVYGLTQVREPAKYPEEDDEQPETPSLSSSNLKLTKHRRPGPKLSSNFSVPPVQSENLKKFNYYGSLSRMHSDGIVVVFLLAALFVVRYNTIIHPFTLADNRHYMFYVFRYTIRRETIRYLLVPIYVLCGWLCWSTLYGFQGSKQSAPPTSTVLIFLLSTTLSLMTAPLVEPRYFILPWVFWRLLVPPMDTKALRESKLPGATWLAKIPGFDPRLVVETLWFVAINAVTMYVFLEKPFYWRVKHGAVVDWSKERFMW